MLNVDELVARGFEMRQISQLIKIDELGYDFSQVNTSIDPDLLKLIKNKIQDGLNNKDVKILLNAIEAEVDIYIFFKKELTFNTLSKYVNLAKDGYNILNSFENYTDEQLDEIYYAESYYDINIEKLINPKFSSCFIKYAAEILEEGEPAYDAIVDYFIENYNDMYYAERVLKNVLAAIDEGEVIDFKKLIDKKYTPEQMEAIIWGWRKDIDVLLHCDNTYSSNRIRMIIDALEIEEDTQAYVDIVKDKRYNDVQMEVLMEWMFELEELKPIKIGLNPKLNAAQMDLLIYAKIHRMDTSYFDNDNLTYEQMYAIYRGIKEGVDVTLYKDLDISGEEMYTIMNALKMKKSGKKIDINFFLDKNISLNEKILVLLDAVKSSRINLNDESLDGIIENNEDKINDYYYEFEERKKEDIIEIICDDGSKIVLTPKSFKAPATYNVHFNEDEPMDEKFVEVYKREIEEITEILSFIKYEDNNFLLYNLFNDKNEEIYINGSISDMDYYIDLAYDEIMIDTISYLMGEDYDCAPLFHDLNELAECNGPDIDKLILKKEMSAFCDVAYIIEKECKTKDISNIKKLFNEVFLKSYSNFAEDTFSFKRLDKDGTVIETGKWYSTFELEKRIKEIFKTSILEIKDSKAHKIEIGEKEY